MLALWVWNINESDTDKFIKFINEKKIDKVFMNYKIYDKFVYNFRLNNVRVIPLIGDSKNELTAEEIINIAKPYSEVHLDIEQATGQSKIAHYAKLTKVIYELKYMRKYVEIDVETWNNDKDYLKIISKADVFSLMSYSKSILGTLIQTIKFRNKPFYIGIETNPELSCSIKHPDKAIKRLDWLNSFDIKYLGIAVHCWGYWK